MPKKIRYLSSKRSYLRFFVSGFTDLGQSVSCRLFITPRYNSIAMVAKKLDRGCRDSISSLPDEVLGLILSFLPTRIAASTSVLSKRWTNLLPLVHNLDFDEYVFLYGDTAFSDLVQKNIALLGDSPIKKFRLRLNDQISDGQSNVYNVLERGVMELDFTSSFQPLDFFFSKTLVKLTLSDGFYILKSCPPGGVLFPALKTLSLFRVCYWMCSPADLFGCLLASPVLEEFILCDDDPSFPGQTKKVWGSSIQKLSILFNSNNQEDHSCLGIDTPNLVYLDYSSYVAQDYDFHLDSLVEARLDLRLWKYCDNGYDPALCGDATKLIAAIRNVETLHLSADSLEVFYFCCKSMPEFNNLVKLSFESHTERGWQVLPLLLKKSPNLKTLVIKGLVHEITDQCGDVCVCVHEKKKKKKKKPSCLLSCRVKFLKIYGYGGSCREVKQMRHFIENLKCLELVKVKVQQDKYVNDLMKLLPTASSKCKIEFI